MAASLLERGAGETASIHTAGSGAVSGIDQNVRAAMERSPCGGLSNPLR